MKSRPVVGVGISMHPDAFARLHESAGVDLFSWNVAEDDLRARIGRCEGLIVYSPDGYRAVLPYAERLRVVSCHACSPETAAELAQRGVRVTLTPTLWDTVADLTIGLMFAAARNIPQADAAIRSGQWGGTDLKVIFSGLDVFGKTLGILGLGKIGRSVARRVQGFDMRLLYHDLERKPDLESQYHLEYVSLADLLSQSDFLIILVPLNDATRGMLGENELRSMKPDAVLINTARGAIVDPQALYRALSEGWIRAAGLDVFAQEPLQPADPLLQLDNVVLAPHLGGSTKECDLALVVDALRVLSGVEPIHPY